MSSPHYVNAAGDVRNDRIVRRLELQAPPRFQALQPGAIAAGIVAAAGRNERFDSVCFDTPDLRLAKYGASLHYRKDEGWTVGLQAATQTHVQAANQRVFAGQSDVIPPEVLDLVQAMVRRDSLAPLAHLRTNRHRLQLLDKAKQRLGEIVDNNISVIEGERPAARFREIEVELADAAPDELLDRLLGMLIERGAIAGQPVPKLVHALGPRAGAVRDAPPVSLGRSASIAEVVQTCLLYTSELPTILRV